MKKALLLCSVIFMFACSNENEVTTPENSTSENATTASKPTPTIENATDEMFFAYVNSESYILLQNKISNFNLKLNLPYIIEFEDSSEMLIWVEANLDLTMFVNLEEATNKWSEIVSLQSLEPAQFPEIYDFMTTAPEELAVEMYNKWLNLKEGTPTVFTTNCEKNFKMCTSIANTEYHRTASYFAQDTQIMADAKRKQDERLDFCRDNYIKCVKN